jgi:hypothetical protein
MHRAHIRPIIFGLKAHRNLRKTKTLEALISFYLHLYNRKATVSQLRLPKIFQEKAMSQRLAYFGIDRSIPDFIL